MVRKRVPTQLPPELEAQAPETIGHATDKIPVELSTRFLEHFSEQLYSSPQKAFEELISNSWDAGADCVDVRISTKLEDPNATMCVLDNGCSMDADGARGGTTTVSPSPFRTTESGCSPSVPRPDPLSV